MQFCILNRKNSQIIYPQTLRNTCLKHTEPLEYAKKYPIC